MVQKSGNEQYSDKEATARFEAALKSAMNTPLRRGDTDSDHSLN
jgi:hypothetical protein